MELCGVVIQLNRQKRKKLGNSKYKIRGYVTYPLEWTVAPIVTPDHFSIALLLTYTVRSIVSIALSFSRARTAGVRHLFVFVVPARAARAGASRGAAHGRFAHRPLRHVLGRRSRTSRCGGRRGIGDCRARCAPGARRRGRARCRGGDGCQSRDGRSRATGRARTGRTSSGRRTGCRRGSWLGGIKPPT